jgi:hypothetical protein
MSGASDLKSAVDKWQRSVMGAYVGGRRLTFLENRVDGGSESVWSARSAIPAVRLSENDSDERSLGILPCVKAITVGLDIREYSRRMPEQQLFLTMCLFAAINRGIELLRRAGMIEPDEPRVTAQTGDGALIVFTSVDAFNPVRRMEELLCGPGDGKPSFNEGAGGAAYAQEKRKVELERLPRLAEQAFSFVFAVNSLIENENRRQGFVEQPIGGHASTAVFPVAVRYAMSYDNVLLMLDVNEVLNCVGRGMVTCARILATDHGNHFLIEDSLLRALAPLSGVNGIGGGVWGQRLHSAVLQEARVKTNVVRYADVFGFYSDGPLLMAQGRHRAPRRQYHIGSHDVGAIDS